MPCPKCTAHDLETKAKMQELFSSDEVTLLAFLLASSLKFHTENFQNIQKMNLKFDVRKNMDFTGTILGKMLVSFDEEARSGIVSRIEKDYGIKLNIKHEACPHGSM